MIGFFKKFSKNNEAKEINKKVEKNNETKINESEPKNKSEVQVNTKKKNFVSKEELRKERAKKRKINEQKRIEEEKIKKAEEAKLAEIKALESKKREEERKKHFEERKLEKEKLKTADQVKYEEEKDDNFNLFGFELIDLKQGMIVEVNIISETNDEYVCEVENSFKEVYLPKSEILENITIGETCKVVIYRHTNDDFYVSQKRLANKENILYLKEKFDDAKEVSGKIINYKEPNFEVQLENGIKVKLYQNNLLLSYLSNPAAYIGKEYKFLLKENKIKGNLKYELTRIPLLKMEQEQNLSKVELDQIISVKNYLPNKAGINFDYEGFNIFVPKSEISYTFLGNDVNYDEYISEGMNAKIIECKKAKNGYNIVASIKRLLPDPFEIFINEKSINDEIEGKIVKIEGYGLFLEIAPNIRGLLHQNDYSNEISSLIKDYKIGDELKVKIKEINTEKKQINLSA